MARKLIVLFLLAVLTTQSGCQIFSRFRAGDTRLPTAFDRAPDGNQLIAHLNERASRVRQLKSNVRVSMDGMPTLRGTLAIERPQRLRLKAGLMAFTEMGVDVGSNENAFWILTRASLPGQTPTMYFATHEGYQRSAIKSALPIEPAWLIDSLGLPEFDANERHEGPFPRPDGRLEMRTFRSTPSGPGIRICVVEPATGVVSQQAIYDSSGTCLAFVNSRSYQLYPDAGISLPQQMELHIYQPDGQTTKLVINAEDYEINSLYGDPEKLWAKPQPDDIQMIDLSTASTTSNPATSRNGNVRSQPVQPRTVQTTPLYSTPGRPVTQPVTPGIQPAGFRNR